MVNTKKIVKLPRGEFTFKQLREANQHLRPQTLKGFLLKQLAEGKIIRTNAEDFPKRVDLRFKRVQSL